MVDIANVTRQRERSSWVASVIRPRLCELVHCDSTKSEIGVALWSLAFGAWLNINPTLFDLPAYEAMRALAGPHFWGSLFFLVGLGGGLAVFQGAFHVRRSCCLLNACVWAGVATMMLQASFRGFVPIGCLLQSGSSLFAYFTLLLLEGLGGHGRSDIAPPQ